MNYGYIPWVKLSIMNVNAAPIWSHWKAIGRGSVLSGTFSLSVVVWVYKINWQWVNNCSSVSNHPVTIQNY